MAPIESGKRRDWRKGGGGHGGSDAKDKVKVEEGAMAEDGSVDMANALAKIRALTGMTRVQVNKISVYRGTNSFSLLSASCAYTVYICTKYILRVLPRRPFVHKPLGTLKPVLLIVWNGFE